jgi:hypothetical protein
VLFWRLKFGSVRVSVYLEMTNAASVIMVAAFFIWSFSE